MNEWKLTKQVEKNWIEDRPIVKNNNTLDRVGELLRVEADELIDAIFIFSLIQNEKTKKEVLQEAADVGLFLIAIFRLLEADMLEEIMEKIAFNTTRYMAKDFQEGDYKETYKRRKQELKEEKWRETFYK